QQDQGHRRRARGRVRDPGRRVPRHRQRRLHARGRRARGLPVDGPLRRAPMARRRPFQEDAENHERWLISYADFITLLFAFFVVMYAVSVVNVSKYAVLSEAL